MSPDNETKIVSRGRSSNLAKVLPYIFKAAFKTFPGKNGETVSVTIDKKPKEEKKAKGEKTPESKDEPEPDT